MECLDSRRLTGPNLFMSGAGAVIDVRFGNADAEQLIGEWQRQVKRMLDAVGWQGEQIHVHRYADGASLAISAPLDALYAATDINDWAWQATRDVLETGGTAAVEADAVRLRKVIEEERNSALLELCANARDRDLPCLTDDDFVSIGLGIGSRTWPVDDLPSPGKIAWTSLHTIPVGLITGTNGKTTSVRMAAAMVRAAGRVVGTCSTDWIAVDDAIIDRGDYSGPGGARAVLRDPRVEVAILETARGGLLRRGLVLERADAILITNVAEDHLGEFALDDLPALADLKWVVTKASDTTGRLVLNADDALLVERARSSAARITWFSADADNVRLQEHVAAGGDAFTVTDGEMIHWCGERRQSLIPVADIPMTLGGAAAHNVVNALGAAGLAAALGMPLDAIASGLRNSRREDHPGRLNVFEFDGVKAIVDFAHNPHGMRALFAMGSKLEAKRRLVLIGQAGDRSDQAIGELADAAWDLRPERIIIKEMGRYARGRDKGEVPGLLRQRFLQLGAGAEILGYQEQEMQAVREAVEWSRSGDVLILLIHEDVEGVTEYLSDRSR
ncbi:MAG: Mur ligase family protein [Gammaproteobacteria bacterium]|nr:MAG: Mur ligase family protein [Gammaproteobacteria bacterium]